jgi:hypothetical protein
MKKWFSIMTSILIIASGYAQHQQVIYQEINQLKASGASPKEMQLVSFISTEIQQRDFNLKGLTKGTILGLSENAINTLLLHRNEFIQLHLPVSDQMEMTLTLKRNDIFTSDFMLTASSDPLNSIPYTPGIHYKGIVEGEPSSIVAMSVFKDQVMGLIATDQGNFVIGRINNDPENRHIFYNDQDLNSAGGFDCQTPDEGPGYTKEQLNFISSNRDVNDCVRLYIEINNDIVTDKGGVVPATDYITGLYNQSFILYTNESIHMMINQIFAWTTPSPYSGTAQQKLSAYQANTSFFNGDLSQLVGYSADGVAAGFNGICNVNPDQSKCYSGIVATYQNVPVFSQAVYFVTHELGHLLGSHHTHACVWNGNNTAIDGCATVEGNCPQLPLPPPNTGTIMSYCWTTGFDFNLGFGPQPGNVIRSSVNGSGNCLTACSAPTNYCLSYGLVSNNKYLQKVVLGSINNLSGNNGGYGNYLSKSTNLTVGNTYTISLTPGSNGSTKYWRVWIDYNGDNDWDDAGELVGQKSGSQVVSFAFTVPSTASLISTRIRVSMAYNAYPANCGSFATGEVEDYTVVILPSQSANFSTALDPVVNHNQLLVYPNPAVNEITLSNPDREILGEVIIYDVTGRIVFQKFVEDTETAIDVSRLTTGLFYVRADQFAPIKMVKQ